MCSWSGHLQIIVHARVVTVVHIKYSIIKYIAQVSKFSELSKGSGLSAADKTSSLMILRVSGYGVLRQLQVIHDKSNAFQCKSFGILGRC